VAAVDVEETVVVVVVADRAEYATERMSNGDAAGDDEGVVGSGV
jgi:hypothetical protein